MLTIGSLFSGVGGLEQGLEEAGLGPVLWQAESDAFARRVLSRHWPNVPRLRDVRDVGPLTVPQVDLICGGFPCQDVSVAGRGAGLHDGTRSGLWGEFARIIDECQPGWVVVENVSQGSSRWLPRVCEDLEELGYSPAPLSVPASALGAPHRRARTFVVADANGLVVRQLEQRESARPSRGVRDAGQAVALDDGAGGDSPGPSPWAALPDLGRVVDGVSAGMDGRRADAADRLRVLGNAVVPACAAAVGRLIVAALREGT